MDFEGCVPTPGTTARKRQRQLPEAKPRGRLVTLIATATFLCNATPPQPLLRFSYFKLHQVHATEKVFHTRVRRQWLHPVQRYSGKTTWPITTLLRLARPYFELLNSWYRTPRTLYPLQNIHFELNFNNMLIYHINNTTNESLLDGYYPEYRLLPKSSTTGYQISLIHIESNTYRQVRRCARSIQHKPSFESRAFGKIWMAHCIPYTSIAWSHSIEVHVLPTQTNCLKSIRLQRNNMELPRPGEKSLDVNNSRRLITL